MTLRTALSIEVCVVALILVVCWLVAWLAVWWVGMGLLTCFALFVEYRALHSIIRRAQR